jgi:hypothetical protein
MSIWHSPTPILGSWRGPSSENACFFKKSIRIGLEIDKGVCQFECPNGVKHVTVYSQMYTMWRLDMVKEDIE